MKPECHGEGLRCQEKESFDSTGMLAIIFHTRQPHNGETNDESNCYTLLGWISKVCKKRPKKESIAVNCLWGSWKAAEDREEGEGAGLCLNE